MQHSLVNFHLLTCCRHSVSNRAPRGKKEEGFKTGRVLQFNGVQLRTARSFFSAVLLRTAHNWAQRIGDDIFAAIFSRIKWFGGFITLKFLN